MERIFISSKGQILTMLETKCSKKECNKSASILVIPDWAPDIYACEEHKQETINAYLKNLP